MWGKDVLAQVWWLKSRSLPLLSLVTDASMVRERCWLFEREATQQIDQQIEKTLHSWHNNCTFTPHTFMTRNSSQPPDILHRWAWTAWHKNKERNGWFLMMSGSTNSCKEWFVLQALQMSCFCHKYSTSGEESGDYWAFSWFYRVSCLGSEQTNEIALCHRSIACLPLKLHYVIEALLACHWNGTMS